MKNQATERILLVAGIVLLLGNLVYNVWWKNLPAPSANLPVSAASVGSTGEQHEIEQQLLSAGLLANVIQWKDDLLLTDEQGQSVPFNQVLEGNTKLVFRFSELSCNTCVDREVGNLKKVAAQVGANRIVVLASYRNLRDLVVFKRINQLEFPVYNVATEAFPADAAGGTFAFLASPVYRGFAPFIPSKDIDNLSWTYYNFVIPVLQQNR